MSERGTQVSQEEFLEDEMDEFEHAITPFLVGLFPIVDQLQ